MASKKGKKVPELKQSTKNNSLEPVKLIDGSTKAPGQTGLHAPDTLDAIRKPKPDQRQDGKPFFGGVSEPKVAEQTYDCYKPSTKSAPKAKKKKE